MIQRWLVSSRFNSVQDGVYALGNAHMRFTSSFRRFPNIAFDTVPMDLWLTMALSRPFKEDRLAHPLSMSLCFRRSMVRCPWLFPAGSVSCSSALQIFRDTSHLRWLLFPPVYLPCHFPLLRYVQGYISIGFDIGCRILTQSGPPISFFTFCSKVTESVMMMACIVTVTSWDNPAEGMCNFVKTYLLNTGRLWNATDWDWIETDRSKFVVVFFVTSRTTETKITSFACIFVSVL